MEPLATAGMEVQPPAQQLMFPAMCMPTVPGTSSLRLATTVASGKWLALLESFRPSLGMERMVRAETEGRPPALNSIFPLACTLTVSGTSSLRIATTVVSEKWWPRQELFELWPGMEPLGSAAMAVRRPVPSSPDRKACTLTVQGTCLLPIPITVGSGKWRPARGLFERWPEMEPLASVATVARRPAPNLIF